MASNTVLPRFTTSLLTLTCIVLPGCQRSRNIGRSATPAVQFVSVPLAEPGDPNKLRAIEGRVEGAQPNLRIVLYARSQTTWWVQPFADRPFTTIQANSTWRNSTHPGVEFAALLVGPDFHPPVKADALPAEGVIASTVTKGAPPFWLRWWFLLACVLAGLCGVFAIHRFRLNQMTARLNARFEERLAERVRVAQILHDTFLQGVISASMQLHVVADRLPAGSPALEPLNHVLRSMGQVVEEGRNTLRGMRSPSEEFDDLGESFSRVPQELNIGGDVDFRVTVRGPTLPLQSTVRIAIYNLGREVLIDALRDTKAGQVDVELRYTAKEFRLMVRHNGRGIDRSALSAIRERAERIGAHLKLRRRMGGGTEIELRVPSHVAFESHPPGRASQWFRGFHRRRVEPAED